MQGICVCAYIVWKMNTLCFWNAAIQGQLGYARHVSLCLHCVRGYVEQAFMSLSLGPLWLKIKILAVGLIPAIHYFFPPTTLGEQSLCYCGHAVSIKLHQTHDWAVSLGWGLQFMKRDFVRPSASCDSAYR